MPRARRPDAGDASEDQPPLYRQDQRCTYGDIVLDAYGLPWRYEPRWPGDDSPWAFCG